MMYTSYSGLGDARPITGAIGGGLLAAAPFAGPAAPFVALAGALTSIIGGLFKPDLTKIEATAIVNQVEAQALRPTLQQWESLTPAQKTPAAQAAALQVVDQALTAVQQGCSNPALGTAGQNCISERLVHGGSAPWCPTGTGCDWVTLYRDPIANDPTVSSQTAGGILSSAESAVSSLTGGGGTNWLPIILIAGLALAVAD
jgi:hypothetical protein